MKTTSAGDGWNDNQKNFAKGVSGFSNSDSGILIFGVKVDKSKSGFVRFQLAPIAESEKLLAKVLENFSRVCAPSNPGCDAKRIPSSADQARGFVVVKIPKSDSSPHQVLSDKKYYQRVGDSQEPMAHHQIKVKFLFMSEI